MDHVAADKQASDALSVPWEGRAAIARSGVLNRILVRIAREALQGDSLDALMQGICDCLVAELPVAIASVILLAWSLKVLPLGTAYAVWTGIGAVGTAILGIYLFDESRDVLRFVCIALIVAGIVGLKLVTPDSH